MTVSICSGLVFPVKRKVMKRIILAHGLKRSGLHGILNWLQAHGSFHFFNNLIPKLRVPADDGKIPEPEHFDEWLRSELAKRRTKLIKGFSRKKFRAAAFFGIKELIGLLEDHELSTRPFTNPPCDVCNVLILRDPENLFSSRIHKRELKPGSPIFPCTNNEHMQRVVRLWKKHAREFLGETNELEHKTCIYYNRWFAERDYRMRISTQMGMPFTDSGFGVFSGYGGGSSFDGRYQGEVSKLPVLSRRDNLNDRNRALLDEILADEEMMELAAQIEAFTQA